MLLSPERELDNLLAMLERRHLSPMELRVLLRLSDRGATPSQLAEGLGGPPGAIRYAARSLSMRGLVRRRFESGQTSRFVFDITPEGRLQLDPLLRAIAETGP
jgi:DNA-binding MarR family transcriptional regulator